MQIEPQIRFRGMEPSSALEAAIQQRIDHLSRFHDHITACNVVVEAPHRHSHQGRLYKVNAHLVIPGDEIVARGGSEEEHAHEDAYVAVRDCFDALQRQLEDRVRKTSGYRIKQHAEKLRGTVDRLIPDEGFGVIIDGDGREFFFRQESVTSDKDWRSLKPGTQVRFDENQGEQGLFASAVSVV